MPVTHLVNSLILQLQNASPVTALLAIGIGMMLESMCVPIPSELILPVAGIWVARGQLSWGGALLAVTAGCLAGSSIAYAIGYYGGEPLVERFGRYILVTPHRLETAQRWIARYGPIAILLGRLMFAVRATISFPVGILRLDYRRFILFTFLGCSIWNLLAVSLGYFYGQAIVHVLHRMSVGMLAAVGIVVLLAGVAYFRKTHMGPVRV
jgi:membrane protein DedA with SNARE-associated domain